MKGGPRVNVKVKQVIGAAFTPQHRQREVPVQNHYLELTRKPCIEQLSIAFLS